MPDQTLVDLIYSDEGEYGWTVRSPSIPGLFGGRSTLVELNTDLPDILSFAGFDPTQLRVRTHIERTLVTPDSDVIVRVAWDEHQIERVNTANRVATAFDVPNQSARLLSVPRSVTGEVIYVCVVPTDTVAWVTDQLGPEGDAAAVALNVAEEMVWTTYFVYDAEAPDTERSYRLSDLGYTTQTTMADLMRDDPVGSGRKLLVQHG